MGIVLTLRVALSAMNKSDSKLMANRRVSSVERILDQEIEGIMPVTRGLSAPPGVTGTKLMFFQGEPQSMRLASTYSLQQGQRGLPMILEFQVIPGADDQGVRLVVNEHWYTGPRGAGAVLPRHGSRVQTVVLPGHALRRSASDRNPSFWSTSSLIAASAFGILARRAKLRSGCSAG